MEYFRIETLEELKQAYLQLDWHPKYDLQQEIDCYEILGYRSIRKNYDGYHYIGSIFWNTIADTEIPNPIKSKMEYFKIETLEELKQAYNQLDWSPIYTLQEEIRAFETLGYRSIIKESKGCHYLASDSFITEVLTEIPNPIKSNKYSVKCKGVEIDVYDVLKAFDVQCPATQHAIKKLLKTGKRGHKDAQQDLTEAIESINRAKELRNE